MPKIESDRITFLPADRYAVEEQSPGITPAKYTVLFNGAIKEGDTTKYFKFLEEIAEKDADILHTLETRSSYVSSKGWTIEGDNEGDAQKIEDALREIPGDTAEGLLTVDDLVKSLIGSTYLVGLSFSEIVSDNNKILGFNHIPAHFLTFNDATTYPKLWTQDKPTGVEFNRLKMISHYATTGIDPARGWLGNAISWLYVLKRTALEAKMQFQSKYGKGFLLLNMPGDKDSYEQAWQNAEDLIENYANVDGAVFPADVKVDFKETNGSLNGQYFFDVEDSLKKSIVQVILGQDSTSSSESSNRSTAEVHMEVLEQRILEDIAGIEDTLTSQLVIRVMQVLGVTGQYKFTIGRTELEEDLDEDTDIEDTVVETIQEDE